MTTPATQSTSALGRRSLPSTFLESIQNARRYMDRRADTDGGIGSSPGSDARDDGPDYTRDDDVGVVNRDGEGALLRSGPFNGLPRDPQAQSASQPAVPMAFAEVARRVWSTELEPNPESRQLRVVPSSAAAATQPVESRGEISAGADAAAGSAPEPAARAGGRQAGLERTSVEQRTVADGAYGLARTTAQSSAQVEAQGLAHDANNLLSALRLYSELLCFSGVLHERHRHYAEDLKLLSLRSQRLIERLLLLAEQVGVAQPLPADAASSGLGHTNVARLWPDGALVHAPQAAAGVAETAADTAIAWESLPGVAGVTPESVSLGDTVRRISGVLGTIARGALQVKLLESEDLRVAIEEEPLERILVNLVANAVAAVSDGGAIRICAGAVEGDLATVALTVDDSGRGMSEAELAAALGTEFITQPGTPGTHPHAVPVQAAAETAGRKRGLGLAIVRQLVAESGGSFFAYSQPGRGTRIEIRWERANFISEHGLETGSRSALAIQSRPDFQPGSEPRSRIQPLPFVSWKNPARPSPAPAPAAAADAAAMGRLSSDGAAANEIKRRAGLTDGTTGSKGAVAC